MREKKTRRAREKMLVSVDKMVDFKGAFSVFSPQNNRKLERICVLKPKCNQYVPCIFPPAFAKMKDMNFTPAERGRVEHHGESGDFGVRRGQTDALPAGQCVFSGDR